MPTPTKNIRQAPQIAEMQPPEPRKDANFITFRTNVFLCVLGASIAAIVSLITFVANFSYGMGKDVGHANFDKEKNAMADSIRTLNIIHADYVDSVEAEKAKFEDAKAKEIIKESVTQKRAEKIEGRKF